MPFDENDFRQAAVTGLGKKAAPSSDARRDLRMFQQAGLNAENVTGDPAWDQLLTFWQAQIEASRRRRDNFLAELANPSLTNAEKVAATRNEIFKLDEQIRVLAWVIAMPAQIKKLGTVAKQRLDEAEAEAA